MRLFVLLLLLVLTVMAAFAVINWNVFITPTELHLGFTTTQTPLGLVMLGALVILAVLFFSFAVYLQTSALLETRRYSRELQANRELAERAEASRFTELRNYLEAELTKQDALNSELKTAVIGKIEEMEKSLRSFMEQTGNTLAAYIGELEDRIERAGKPSGEK